MEDTVGEGCTAARNGAGKLIGRMKDVSGLHGKLSMSFT
jgi:hypothetical protein